MRSPMEPVLQSFWANVDQSGGPAACWPWTGGANRPGPSYGTFRITPGTSEPAHRFALQATTGEDARGWFVCHHCDNPPCCNPAHLFFGTPKDNTRDAMRKGRLSTGEANGAARLTTEAVVALRSEYAAGGVSYEQLGRRFGVSIANVGLIVSGARWTAVGGPTFPEDKRGRGHKRKRYCTIPDCGQRHVAKGLCKKHWDRAKNSRPRVELTIEAIE